MKNELKTKSKAVEVVIISDTHLGTHGCHAYELFNYLKSIKPKTLIINGDFIDIWQFKKNYFPKSHLKVVKRIIDLASKGTKVVYITGNHDEMLRRFADFKMGNFELCNKKILRLDNQNIWVFHGDVFDMSVQHSKWIAKLGGHGYDLLIRMNAAVNWGLSLMGKEKYSFSKKIKASVKKAVKFIGDFEKTAADLANEHHFDAVICGHIHQPCIKSIVYNDKTIQYMNSGDWVENLTALEYDNKQWTLFNYNPEDYPKIKKYQTLDDDYIKIKSVNELISDVMQFNK